jgi:hypothetical protein
VNEALLIASFPSGKTIMTGQTSGLRLPFRKLTASVTASNNGVAPPIDNEPALSDVNQVRQFRSQATCGSTPRNDITNTLSWVPWPLRNQIQNTIDFFKKARSHRIAGIDEENHIELDQSGMTKTAKVPYHPSIVENCEIVAMNTLNVTFLFVRCKEYETCLGRTAVLRELLCCLRRSV